MKAGSWSGGDLQLVAGGRQVGDRPGVVDAVAPMAGEQRQGDVGGAGGAGRAGEQELRIAAARAVTALTGEADAGRLAPQQKRRAERGAAHFHRLGGGGVGGQRQALGGLGREGRHSVRPGRHPMQRLKRLGDLGGGRGGDGRGGGQREPG
jgi:hypothetical protein